MNDHYSQARPIGSKDPFIMAGVVGSNGVPITDQEIVTIRREAESSARAYLHANHLEPTPDAVDQMVRVFLPCLKIMCERPWDPEGGTWRQSGFYGILTDVRKKFQRLWERGWTHGKRHDDSAFDLINYIGMYLRSDPANPWGDWGEPGEKLD